MRPAAPAPMTTTSVVWFAKEEEFIAGGPDDDIGFPLVE
jgi:hypothetical protein